MAPVQDHQTWRAGQASPPAAISAFECCTARPSPACPPGGPTAPQPAGLTQVRASRLGRLLPPTGVQLGAGLASLDRCSLPWDERGRGGSACSSANPTACLLPADWPHAWASRNAASAEHALISLLALNGLRVSEVTGADIEALGIERGHRTLVITHKGGKWSPSRSRRAPPGRSTWPSANAPRAPLLDRRSQTAGPPRRRADRPADSPPRQPPTLPNSARCLFACLCANHGCSPGS
jgi:hypothetical protein